MYFYTAGHEIKTHLSIKHIMLSLFILARILKVSVPCFCALLECNWVLETPAVRRRNCTAPWCVTYVPVTRRNFKLSSFSVMAASFRSLPSSCNNKWYYTRQQIDNSPSRQAGLDPDKELSYRQQAANLLQDMGQRLNVYLLSWCVARSEH